MQEGNAKWKLITSMMIFGTIGLFVRHIPLPSSVIALCRGVTGTLFLVALLFWRKMRLDFTAIRKNLMWLLLSGAAIGFNWILLFESYRYTSVAVSTLCYYLAPILVILVSPLLLKEQLTGKKITCVVAALCGMICLSGVLQSGIPGSGELKGILFGVAAALLYASIILMNKQLSDIAALEKTIVQLGTSAVVLLPYCFMTLGGVQLSVDLKALLLLIVVGVIHTGVSYAMYFDALGAIRGQTAAILSYIDPVIAVLASVLILREPMQGVEALGAVLILGAAVISEVSLPKRGAEK